MEFIPALLNNDALTRVPEVRPASWQLTAQSDLLLLWDNQLSLPPPSLIFLTTHTWQVQFFKLIVPFAICMFSLQSDSSVNSVRGQVIGNIIQCTFAATVPSSTARSTNLLLSLSTGTFNSSKLRYFKNTLQFTSTNTNTDGISVLSMWCKLLWFFFLFIPLFCFVFSLSASGELGNPVENFRSSSVDLTNNNISNVNNEISGSMSNSLTFKQSLTQGRHS